MKLIKDSEILLGMTIGYVILFFSYAGCSEIEPTILNMGIAYTLSIIAAVLTTILIELLS